MTLSGLFQGDTFKVRLRARYHSGEHEDSPWSGPWTAEVTQRVRAPAPAAPTGLTATVAGEDGDAVVNLSWTAPDHSDLTGYRICRGPDTHLGDEAMKVLRA